MKKFATHRTHLEIVKRLRRAEGHLRKTVTMIEDGRPCVDLAQQLQAVEKAIAAAKRTLIQDHIDHCLDQAGRTHARASLDEFKLISGFL